jgi:hypothetical protein
MRNKAGKILPQLIAVIVASGLLAVMPLVAHAAESGGVPAIYVTSAEGNVGDIVDVNIGLANNPGIISMLLSVNYDMSALSLVSVEDKGIFGAQTHSNRLISPYKLLWENGTASGNYTVNGDLATLQFEILSSSGSDITVSYGFEKYEIIDWNLNAVHFDIINGSVTKPVVLGSIAVTRLPTKTEYFTGESLNPSGMVVMAYYSDNSSQTVTGYDYNPKTLNTAGTQTVTVSYTEGGVTKTDSFTVEVNAAEDPPADPILSITGLTLIERTRNGLTAYNYIFSAQVTNSGGRAAGEVTANLTGAPAGVVTAITKGDIAFGNVPAGETVTSSTYFTIVIPANRTSMFDESDLEFGISWK